MRKLKDRVISVVRKARAEVWEMYQRDPLIFYQESEQIRKRLKLRRSKLKPVAKTLKEMMDQKLRKK